MILDLIKIPNRYTEEDAVLDTSVPCFSCMTGTDEYSMYGRKIPLDVFVKGKLTKYKLINVNGNWIEEKLFFAEEDLDFNKSWWTSKVKAYPIQSKLFSRTDPLYGRTIKYVNGISDLIVSHIDGYRCTVPTALIKHPIKDPELFEKSLYSVVIPSMDSNIIDDDYPFTPTISVKKLDNWINEENTMDSLFNKPTFIRPPGWFDMNMIGRPFDDSGFMVNANPINYSWQMYELLTYMNDIPVSDISIDLDCNGKIDIRLSTRYTNMTDITSSPRYDTVVDDLEHYVKRVMSYNYNSDPWVKICIRKLWSEEVYMTLYVECSERSKPIETEIYVDLPVFCLGTVGLR